MEISQIVIVQRLQSIADIYLGEDSSMLELNPWLGEMLYMFIYNILYYTDRKEKWDKIS